MMDNYSVSIIPDQDDAKKSARIELSGELSIQYIHEIRDQLDKAISNFKNIELFISDVYIIDLTILQYFISLKKSEKMLDKSIKFSFELSEGLKELIEHAGFNHIEN